MVDKFWIAKLISRKTRSPIQETDIFDVIPLAKGVLAIMSGTKEKHFFSWQYLKKGGHGSGGCLQNVRCPFN